MDETDAEQFRLFGVREGFRFTVNTDLAPVAGNRPVNTFISVDFPAPFSPINAWTSPEFRVRLISLST